MHAPSQPVAVVIGAASGIGRAFVEELADRGHACIAADRDIAGLAELRRAPEGPGPVELFAADVVDAQAVERLAQYAFERFGGVDLLVNSAGVLGTGCCWEMTPIEWRRVLDVNFFGLLNAVHAFIPRLIEQRRGHVLNVASMAAVTAGAHVGAYTASKHAVLALSECLARELAEIGSPVRVSVTCPGPVATGITRDLGDSTLDRYLKALIAGGMPPRTLASLTLDAMDAGHFCIFPHAEVSAAARHRLDQLIEGTLKP